MLAKLIAIPAIASTLSSILIHALPQPQTHLQAPFVASSRGVERYEDDQVWRLNWSTYNQTTKDDILSLAHIMDLDIWHNSPKQLDLRMNPFQSRQLLPYIPHPNDFTTFIDNLQSLVDRADPSGVSINAWDVSSIKSVYHEKYHNLEDVYGFADALEEHFNGLGGIHIESFSLGKSFEGREIRGWKTWMEGGNVSLGDAWREREFVVQSGQHAREWVGPSTAVYFLHSLLLGALGGDPMATLIMQTFAFTIVPTINPDGYVYSHQHSRMWRKNRQHTGSNDCLGIDLNANWGYKWKKQPQGNPCQETYAGQSAFEAYETRAVADYLLAANGPPPRLPRYDVRDDKSKRVRAFVDLHSYGQLFMYPFAHSCDNFPPDAEMLLEAGLGVAKAMRLQAGEEFEIGQACDLTYRAPGDAIDFSYGVTDVRWSYSAELRDTGLYGFMLPPEYIRPSGEEITAGLMFLAKFIYDIEVAG